MKLQNSSHSNSAKLASTKIGTNHNNKHQTQILEEIDDQLIITLDKKKI